jgi:hypothetical protein
MSSRCATGAYWKRRRQQASRVPGVFAPPRFGLVNEIAKTVNHVFALTLTKNVVSRFH